MNIIMIVSDTFRKDNLNCYSPSSKARTPFLDKFSDSSVIFDRAYANSFPTMPARADFITGRYTFTYRGWQPMGDETSLAQQLSSAGYLTMGVVDTPFFQRDGYHFDKGFDDFIFVRGAHAQMADGRDVRLSRVMETDFAAPKTMFEAERWLQRHYKEKFFLYVDTWDPHEPWDAPVWYSEQYDAEFPGGVPVPAYGKYREKGFTDKDLKDGYSAYRGEVTMVDRWIGRLLDTVSNLGLLEDTIILFVSDHGYYFGEHGYYGKSVMGDQPFGEVAPNPAKGNMNFLRSPLYQEVINIPLLFSIPGIQPRRTPSLVSHADLAPTLLDLVGIDVPEGMQGKSFSKTLMSNVDSFKEFVVSSWPLYNIGETVRDVDSFARTIKEPMPSTITYKNWQMLYTGFGIESELYNLDDDPKQCNNLFSPDSRIAKEMHEKFVNFLEDSKTSEELIAPRRKFE